MDMVVLLLCSIHDHAYTNCLKLPYREFCSLQYIIYNSAKLLSIRVHMKKTNEIQESLG